MLTGKNRSTRGKTCPSATLSTTNPKWTDPGSNPGLRGERISRFVPTFKSSQINPYFLASHSDLTFQ
jgi:hypothetical protein